MSVPGIVQSTLNGEEIAARVSLGGEDELFITPSSTLVYSSEGLLSDESIDEYPHEADRLTLSEGRRKTKFTLEYPLEGTKSFSVPGSKTDGVLHPVLAGVLNGNGITDPGETVAKTYRFSELTLIITSDRLVKHIGAAVWDGDYEEYHFEDVTSLAFEDGSVATQIVLTVDGRPQRIKAPNEQANDLRERLQRALFEYHDVGSLEELNEKVGGDDEAEQRQRSASVDFGEGVDPLDANPPSLDDHEPVDETAGGVQEPAATPDPLADETPAAGSDANEPQPAAESSPTSEPQGHQDPEQASTHREQTETQSVAQTPAETDPATGQEADPAASEAETFEMSAETVSGHDSDLEGTEPTEIDTEPADIETTPTQDDGGLGTDSTPLLGTDPEPDDDVTDELLERVEALEVAVERQTEVIERQQGTIEQLIAELRKQR
ncbi:DUF7115 domain-containing protein [Natronorubrum tibetense]|uniref:DUF7115 domain-containing protein n=1 Tax=Natronorubrum tibetense GA33 TaxID=1114856 RepID=L9W8R3_9EURY|nr:hypothetical protein [Natronorubrum tibetense]ELY45742.1 hypothetical protein C496_02332 [Natronorubrum tibetense GA33]